MTQLRGSNFAAPRLVVRLGCAAAGAAVALAASSPASAAGDEAIRVSADVPIAGFYHRFADGLGSATDGFFGLAAAPFQLGVGYLFKKNIYVGGRFGFRAEFPDSADTYFHGRLTGRFEYVFDGSKVRPFVGADLGFYGDSFGGVFGGAATYGGFLASGSGGVHLFVTDSFSISPYGELIFQRYFDFADLNTVTLVFGVTLAGWIWR
jgi:hypothetical protein